MSDKKAKIKLENKSFDLPIVEGSMGHSAIDARKLNQHQLLSDKFFKKNPPKSTGREYFNARWLLKNLNKKIDPQSVQRTILELTVQAIFQSAQTHCKQIDEIYVCGGGSQNKFLMLRLSEQFNKPVQNTESIGIPSQEVESVAFAWLAKTCLEKQFNNSPQITGSLGLKVLGVLHHG